MEQFDITEFARMFDAALASDNPAVKKALRNFMLVAAIVHAEEQTGEGRPMGPLETLVKKVADLEHMMYKLQNERTYKDQYRDYNNPTWVYQPNTSVRTTNGTTSWSYSNSDDDEAIIKQLMKELTFNDKN